ncbi:preprotein translocase subunit SecE [Candidatus Endowatersipora endosymbiont of Watersipora subatra]|uniref:preprotein translocase subunit SecE n=1 Tax=Candidatus Endowatersipora endosymbiont of Watersipora subatra TaxID=3077946 RepID=UPI00312CB452
MIATTNPFIFFSQVRSEVLKIVWPSRRETMITTIMTLTLILLTALFFFFVDQLLIYGTSLIFG